MKIYDENNNEVTNPDLTVGYLTRTIRIKPDAVPLGGDKVVWDDDDYEEIDRYVLYTEEELAERKQSEERQVVAQERETMLEGLPTTLEDMNAQITQAQIGLVEVYEAMLGGGV